MWLMAKRAGVLWVCVSAALLSPAQTGEITPDEKFLWSCYMICFPTSRDFRGFKDRPLDRPPADGSNPRLIDLRNAVDAGADALSIDLFVADKHALPCFGRLVKLINDNKLPIQLTPMFDGMQNPSVTVDDFVAKVGAWFERFAREPCVVRLQGKPVLFTYGAYGFSPKEWQTAFARLKDAGHEGCWMAEMGRYLALGQSLRFDPARPWLDLFQAGNIFSARRPERTAELVRAYRSAYPPPRRWVGSTAVGYWRPEVSVYSSQHGTRSYRDSWRAIVDNDIRWVQQATWNDFSENHHIMPSENYSTTYVELTRYLAERWKGRTPELDSPCFYLSHMQELTVGEGASIELMAMLRPQNVPAKMVLTVKDGHGQEPETFGPVVIADAGLQTAALELRLTDMPPGRLVFPEARLLDGGGKVLQAIRGSYMLVYPGGYRPERNYSWIHTPAHRQVSGIECRFALDGHTDGSLAQRRALGKVSLRVDSPVPLADVEVLHDGVQVVSLCRLQHIDLGSPVVWDGMLPVSRRGRLDWGAYAVRAVTCDGRTATGRPVFVERPPGADITLGLWTFDRDEDTDILDSSPWLHDGRLGGRPRREPWRPKHVADQWGGRCLRFDGVDDRVLLEGPIVPPDCYTVECWVKPDAQGSRPGEPQLLFAAAGAAVILHIDPKGKLAVSRKTGGQWLKVSDAQPLTPGRWQHVAATYDGSTLRLYRDGVPVGEKPSPMGGRCGQVSIGYNSVTNGSFYCGDIDEVRLSARSLRPEEFGPHNPRGRKGRTASEPDSESLREDGR